jgi:hypothetical protein
MNAKVEKRHSKAIHRTFLFLIPFGYQKNLRIKF